MRQSSPHSHPQIPPSSRVDAALWKVAAALCTAVGAAAMALSPAPEPPPRSPAAARAEEDTRALLDERMAVHLRRLR